MIVFGQVSKQLMRAIRDILVLKLCTRNYYVRSRLALLYSIWVTGKEDNSHQAGSNLCNYSSCCCMQVAPNTRTCLSVLVS